MAQILSKSRGRYFKKYLANLFSLIISFLRLHIMEGICVIFIYLNEVPVDSSVGRAMDCSSIGHVFNSHSTDTDYFQVINTFLSH